MARSFSALPTQISKQTLILLLGFLANPRIQDELKLLRVRTKKQELVIVPDVKYLLIVIHETPAA